MAEATIKHGGNLSSLMSKVFLIVSVSVTCFLLYRVYVLETRVNHLEKQLANILTGSLPENADIAKITSVQDAAKVASVEDASAAYRNGGGDHGGVFSRRKRNAQECACPPGEFNELFNFYDRIGLHLRVGSRLINFPAR